MRPPGPSLHPGGWRGRGAAPFHKKAKSNRNSPPRADRRAREFRFPARSAARSEDGAPFPVPVQLPAPAAGCAPPVPPSTRGGWRGRGTAPFHKKAKSNRNAPPRADRRAREFRFPARSAARSEDGAPFPVPVQLPAPAAGCAPPVPPSTRGVGVEGGPPPSTRRQSRIGTRRRAPTGAQGSFDSRREAPRGPKTGRPSRSPFNSRLPPPDAPPRSLPPPGGLAWKGDRPLPQEGKVESERAAARRQARKGVSIPRREAPGGPKTGRPSRSPFTSRLPPPDAPRLRTARPYGV